MIKKFNFGHDPHNYEYLVWDFRTYFRDIFTKYRFHAFVLIMLFIVLFQAQDSFCRISDLIGIAPRLRTTLIQLENDMSLPKIRGFWFHVDPMNGSVTADGRSFETAVTHIDTAYRRCVSGRGDGIILYSAGTTTAHTTSYILDNGQIDWTKNAITVFGVCSPTLMFQRSRIANKGTTGDSLDYLIDVQGDNNTFINMSWYNGGVNKFATGCVKVSGNRNTFIRNHMMGGAGRTARESDHSLFCSGQENTYFECVFGTDTHDCGDSLNADIIFDGSAARITFVRCATLAYTGSGTKHGAFKSADATSIQRDVYFIDSRFTCFQPNSSAALASAFIGTKPTSGFFIIQNSIIRGYDAWDDQTGNDCVYVSTPAAAASGAGGIPTTP
jgi:hypothetical protein